MPGGTAVEDACGVCDGDRSICADCAGVQTCDSVDIGCGCGVMSIEIAKQTEANLKGITLSANQYNTASKRVQEEGYSDKN